MNLFKYFVVSLIIFIIYSCTSSDPVIRRNVIKTGNFNYVMTDSSGTWLTAGKIKLDYVKGSEISGTYTVVKDSTVTFEGQETMKDGPFSGHYNDSLSLVFFNLNPRVADANIFINANDHGDSLKGGWYYSTFRGKASGGLFTAKRVK